jgi:hypothetical protein
MKFGKELRKAIDMSDPEWGPYWPNYKVLKVIELLTCRHRWDILWLVSP